MNVRPAGREACECASPINQILERLDQMDADIASAQQAANTAVGTATAQAGTAAASAANAQADAAAALINAGAAQDAADDAHDEAVAAAGSAQDAADDAADALLALQNIESTIASVLATDIGAKVDKLTTSGFHLYTHNGSTQGEVAPDINPTAATIPIRDSSGKLFGADPASGATDKTLVTANWVSQSGSGRPNNIIHAGGNENFTSPKTFDADIKIKGIYDNKSSQNVSNSSTWIKVYECVPNVSNQMLALLICPQKPYQNSDEYGILIVGGSSTGPYAKWMLKGQGIVTSNFIVVGTTDNTLEVWIKNYNGNRGISCTRLAETNWGNLTNNWSVTQVTDASFDYTTYPHYKVSE